jgi:formate--tetrahydrofolate ligase
MIHDLCKRLQVECATHEAFLKGGEGVIDLAEKVVAAAQSGQNVKPKFLYELKSPVMEKAQKIATSIYGATNVYFEKKAQKKIASFVSHGYGDLPICMAKTQASLTDNPRVMGAPKDWTLTVTDAQLSAGAGFLVMICGDMMLMPGLPSSPAAVNMDVDEDGRITGLF